MAQKSRSNKSSDEIKIEIARGRERMTRDLQGLRYELDFPAKVRRSMRQNTGTWVGAALVVGTLVVLLPLRRKKIYVDSNAGKKSKGKSGLLEAGFLLGALRIAATLLKPAITSFLARKFSDYGSGFGPRRK